jgi:glycosyltransferase involved in cell wall biosynthesis
MRAERIESKRAVVDAAMFSTSAENKVYSTGDTKKLIYVGRLAPEKNLGMLLRAVARAVAARGGSPCLRLTIAGTGPLEQDLRSEASQLRIERIVDFVGYCPQHDLPGLLRAADFFVLPSSREPWGLAALEAMLCRLPVIVSTQCGCAEDLITDETGWKFSPWTEDELSELLRRLPDMPASMVARMGTIAHQVASGYSPEFCARSIEQCVEQATAGRRIARPSSPMPVPERIRSSEER